MPQRAPAALFLGQVHVIKWVVVVVERGRGEADGESSGLVLSEERGVRKKTRERETDRQRQTETERDRDRRETKTN